MNKKTVSIDGVEYTVREWTVDERFEAGMPYIEECGFLTAFEFQHFSEGINSKAQNKLPLSLDEKEVVKRINKADFNQNKRMVSAWTGLSFEEVGKLKPGTFDRLYEEGLKLNSVTELEKKTS